MKIRGALLMTLLLAPPLTGVQAQGTFSEKDTKSIAAASHAFSQALVARDVKALATFYTEDGTLYPPGETMVKGRAAIEACLVALPHLRDFELRILKTEGREDLAYVQGTFTMTVAERGLAETIQITGYYIEIRRRQTDGTWPIAVQMFTPHE